MNARSRTVGIAAIGTLVAVHSIAAQATPPLPPPAATCIGDCNLNGAVSVDELLRGVNIALGSSGLDQCAAFECNAGGKVTVDCLVRAVGVALDGCPPNVADPTVEGPVTGGLGMPFVATTAFDLAEVGYSGVEFFFAGTAAAYTNVGPLTPDGKWTVTPATTAAYKTRMIAYRPIDSQAFNGTVIVEWLNVSGGLDAGPDWIMAHTELIREGYAWVGISAQKAGVDEGSSIVGLPPMPLKDVDPVRYASLVHPGDSFSYDIFSQAGQAVRHPTGLSPLGDLAIERVIAAGESQSAFRFVTYINAIHPLARIYDGFFVHSRGAIGVPLSEAPLPQIPVPGTAPIRSDVTVPVLTLETETDLIALSYYFARQPDSEHFRLWEVAGTAHADTYTSIVGRTDRGDDPEAARLVLVSAPVPELPQIACSTPINSGPQHFVLKAAIAALNRWVRDGTPPPIAPRLEVAAGPPVAIVRDADGNALGGIRTPQLDVPIATYSGNTPPGSVFCLLFGSTTPFDEAELSARYADHESYVAAFNDATDQAVANGFILPIDAQLMKDYAAGSDIGR